MVESLVEVLLEEIPKLEIRGIYFKGSAQKEWDSPLDYVPELSDVDIHLLFTDDSSIDRYLGSIPIILDLQSKVEARFLSKNAKPLHIPRLQLIVLNHLLQEEDYIPSPEKAVSVLYGKGYPKVDASNPDMIRGYDCKRLLNEEEFLSELPLRVIDKPCKYLWYALRLLFWHVSPIGPRILHISGLSYDEVWSINRTQITSLLRETGKDKLAEEYSQFYLSSWNYFLSDYADTDAGRSSITAGVNVLQRGVEIASSWLSKGSTHIAETSTQFCT